MANNYEAPHPPLRKGAENRHHVFFYRRWYTSTFEKRRFREHPGFLHVMPIPEHNELHAIVPPPPKPDHALMERAVSFMESLPEDMPRVQQLGMAVLFFAEQAERDDDHRRVAARIAGNLAIQHYIIENGAEAYEELVASGQEPPLAPGVVQVAA